MNGKNTPYGRIISSLISMAVLSKICWRLTGVLDSLLMALIVTGIISVLLLSMFGTRRTSSK